MRKAIGRIGELLKRFGGRLTPSGCALRVPEAKRGRVPCDGAEEVCKMHALQMQTRQSQQKAEKATAPPP